MLRFSVIINKFGNDNSNEFDHEKSLSHLPKQSTVDLFFNKASFLHPYVVRSALGSWVH